MEEGIFNERGKELLARWSCLTHDMSSSDRYAMLIEAQETWIRPVEKPTEDVSDGKTV